MNRREFLRLGSVASVTAYLGVGDLLRGAVAAAEGVAHRPAELAAPIRGLAMHGRHVLGVGGDSSSGPLVWISSHPWTRWSVIASSSSFPHNTHLTGVASLDGTLVAIGAISELASQRTVQPARGGPIKESVFALRPSVFLSRNGESWRAVERPPLRAEGGELTFVAGIGARVVAVGIPEGERGVTDGSRPSFASTTDLEQWEWSDLGGLASKFFGVTMLVSIDQHLLIGTDDWIGGRLYSWAPGGSAKHLPGPSDGAGVWYTAAADRGQDILLAGIDASGRGRQWSGRPGSWAEVDVGSSIKGSYRIHAMLRVGGSILLATSAHGRSSVLKVEI